MVSPAPFAQPWPAPSRGPAGIARIGGAIVLILFLTVFLAVPLLLSGGIVGFDASFLVFAVCGILMIAIVLVVAVASGVTARRSIPPPPPIQQPMVPATGGTVELACPNCGAAPRNVDRFGIATCDYCETRFLVR